MELKLQIRRITTYMEKNLFLKKGFTLAEVLITLGIIGVVAAMTMPVLVQNYKRIETASRLKKFYSMMNQAIKLSELDNGDADTWTKADTQTDEEGNTDGDAQNVVVKDFFMKYLAPYIKYVKYEDGKNIIDADGNKDTVTPAIYFVDGSSVAIWNGGCMDFIYDVNGKRNPNEAGRDQFRFIMCFSDEKRKIYTGKEKIMFYPITNFQSYGNIATPRETMLSNCKNDGSFCTILIMQDGWEIKSDYPYKL